MSRKEACPEEPEAGTPEYFEWLHEKPVSPMKIERRVTETKPISRLSCTLYRRVSELKLSRLGIKLPRRRRSRNKPLGY